MLFAAPTLSAASRRTLAELDDLRAQLGRDAERAGPWMGALRRSFRATDAGSSTAIEGFTVSADDALALVDGTSLPAADDDDARAFAAYARAMAHVAVMADDPDFRWSGRVLKDLHFDACGSDAAARPGRWRTTPVSVTGHAGSVAYRGPDASDVPELMAEVSAWLDAGDPDAHVVVRAAMAHLHVVSVHPFADGNGRVSRIVQSLVLAHDGLLAPDLGSIEEYLADHTDEYYAVLRSVQGGSYRPDRDAGPWLRFCLRAHVAQARRRLDLIAEAGRRWGRLEEQVAARGWPDRLVIALEQALFGRTDRAAYALEAGVSAGTASADLRRLVDAGLLDVHGRTRNAHYRAAPPLTRLARGA
jgi:Fic family protein